jgi:alpha-L-rhamnosidase
LISIPSATRTWAESRWQRTLFMVLVSFMIAEIAGAKPAQLRCEYLQNPLGIDIERPSLSWRSDNTEQNWRQSAYEILVASRPELLRTAKTDVWDSGKQSSGESAGVAYGGPKLESRKRYFWSVRVWDARGHTSEAAEPAWWETGLLNKSDWTAKWIRWENPEASLDRGGIHWIWVQGQDALASAPKTVAAFRLNFDLPRLPQRAALYLIARGNWSVTVNGHDAGAKNDWNEFDRRDIGTLLVQGKNAVEITVTVPPRPPFGPNAGAPESARPAGLAALVKITHEDGEVERMPTDGRWQAHLQGPSEWQAAAVAGELSDNRFGTEPGPLPERAGLLRKAFTISKPVQTARLYATALGSYRMFINGQQVSHDVLTPGFTDFAKRVQYQAYDVTALLAKGENIAGAVLGAGWFGSGMSWSGQHFGILPPARFLIQIEITYRDGTHESLVTDQSWRAAGSAIMHSEIYAGETYDARLEQPGWNKTKFDDSKWRPAVVSESYTGILSSQPTAPPQVVSTIKPERINPMPDGSYVFDMGQNMVGWAALKVSGPAGTTVRLRFAEILNPDGSIYRTNLRNADATDSYTLRGGGEETFTPKFTFHGFRYVEVTGYPGKPTLDSLSGQVVSSLSGEPTARLTTSSDLVNRMWTIGIWGQRGNFLSVPTDCPQRDERLGWMGDAGVFWRTGSYNFDIAAFTNKWMHDVVDAQLPNGAFTNVAPDIGLGTEVDGAPGWADAGVILPWTTWLQYGDRSVIDRNWDAMERYMKFIQDANPDFIRRNKVGPNFGDWLAPETNTDKDLISTAYWALVADMMSQMAHATGKEADAKRYADVFGSIRAAFQKAYVKDNGQVGNGTQTSYVLALHMNLLPPALEHSAVDNLVKDIEAHDGHLTTGFLGTPFLLFALSNHGRTDVAYRLLLNETYPSWGYMLSKGATTWWERWNGDTGDPAMNSYNHYAFGSVVAWVYRCVVGIDTDLSGPGFHEIVVHPRPDPRITEARGEYESVYGKITTEWNGTPAGPFTLNVNIPANTTARIMLPAVANAPVTQNGKKIDAREESGNYVVRVGSGSYQFQVK